MVRCDDCGTLVEDRGSSLAPHNCVGRRRHNPNPTEEQTSPRTFEEWFRDYWEAEAASGYTDESVARATWDARQPEIDRLRAALKAAADRGRLGANMATAHIEHVAPFVQQLALIDREAREALDG